MGAKESKLGFLAYEDALKRVTDDELKRLRDAFKRSCGLAYMNQQCFVREVLGEGVPPKVAEVIYNSFGGSSKGLSFKELVVGLVLLTRGRDEEKIKYIFSLCANESGSYVSREGLEGLLQACETQPLAETVRQCFRESERANYERFKQWLLANKELLILSRWLLASTVSVTLTDDSDTPTFYQTLAGVTHLEESDIIDLEKRYWLLKAQSRTGHFDLETFAPLVSPPLPPSLTEGIFNAFDENRDNHIDFKEISCGLSACCRGPLAERQKFCFKVFDRDRDGLLSWLELHDMVEALLIVWCGNRTELCPEMNMETAAVVNAILQMHDTNQEKSLSLEDYQIWSVTSTLAHEFLTLLFQVCHIVLGLRPASPGEEGQIIRGWLEREHRQGFRPGQLWYLISMQWWQQWKDYVRYDTKPVVSEPLSVSCSRGRSAARAWENGDAPPPHSTPSGSSLDSVSLASEASESMGFPQPLTPATESCFLTHSQSLSPDGATTRCFGNSVPSSASQPIVPQQACLSVGPQKPGVIDNVPLINSDAVKVPTLTAEGGRLKCSPPLMWGQDYEIVPDPVWRSLSHWYGYNIVLPRTVIPQVNGRPLELELYPVCIYLLRHQQPPTSARPIHNSMFGGVASAPAPPKRYLAYTACFSTMLSVRQIHEFLAQRLRLRQEDLRLWLLKDENNLTLLDDDEQTIKSLRIEDNQQILIEVRNKDMSWPEEMSSLANRKNLERSKLVPTEKGATGLSNLGNTCFMNSSIQCVSNTRQLTQYFLSGMHLYELNRTNPLGMKGHMAKCYGDLINELWSGTQKNVAPLKLRWTIGKYAPRFNGFQQQDSQELLAFLLDGLHEDLNRVHDKPYVELKDSDGRPDHEVATEAWENHLLRNKSIVVDLFHGQLKSQVRCKMCDHVSVRFDPFNFLSLPLPMDSSMHVEITVIRLDGSVPVRYGLRLGVEDKYSGLKQQLSELCSLQPQQILLAEVFSSNIRNFPDDNQKVRSGATSYLCAFEIPVLSGDPASTSPTDAHFTPIGEERATSDALAPADVGCLRKAKSDSCMPSSSSSGCSPAGGAGGLAKSASNGLTNGHLAQSCRPEQLGGVQPSGYAIAVHRKMMRMEVYFLSSHKNRPSLFGMPLIVPCAAGTQHCHLYDLVWGQVARLVSPLPPQEASNHAQDCDDSLGYQYPFTLSAVQKDGVTCAWCPWYRFCRGCKIECNTVVFVGSSGVYIAIDWDPTALHLRYQTAQERVCLEHESVGESRRAQTEPISLNSCLQAFTKEEELGEDELYYCSKCRAHRLASKKLDIWRLPPSLIIHLKRFQFVNGRWIKSHKIVKFPRRGLDPSAFLAPRRDPEDAHAVSPATATAEAAATTAMFATAAAAIAALKEVQHDIGGGTAAAPGANLYGGLDAVHSSSSSDSGFAVGAKASGGGSNSPSPSSGGSRTGSPAGSPRFGTKARSHLRPKQFAPGKGPLRLARGKKKDGLAGSRENLQGVDSAAPCKGQAPLHGGDSKASSTDAVSAAGGGGAGFVGGAGEDALSLVLPNDQNPNGDSGQQCLPSTESGRQGCVRVCESGLGPECSDSSRLRDAFRRAGSGASLEVVSTCGGGSRSDHGDNAEGSVQVAGEVCLERSSSETLEGGSGEALGAAVSCLDTLDTSSSGFSSKEDLSAQDGVKEDCGGDMWPTSVASNKLPNGAPGIGAMPLEPSASADRSDCETETSEDSDETKPIYDLYAISCHSGIMGGGHYVTYARNPNTKWYCYNDSSCKEVHEDEIDTDSAYLLFYERRGLDGRAFLPTLHGRCPVDTSSLDEDFESDYRKYCVIQ